MAIHRKLSQVGGSIALIVPRDIADAIGIGAASSVSITVVGRSLVIDPDDDTLSEKGFRRALRTVLRKHSSAFRALAAHDKS